MVRALAFPIVPLITVLLMFAAVVISSKIVKPSSVIITGVVSLLVTFIIFLPLFSTVSTMDNRNELLSKGTHGKATVIEKKHNRNNPKQWQIKCGFTVNNRRYETSYYPDNEGVHSVGDTIDILYNKDYPRMYKLNTSWLY
jgi:hypothetical protein